MAFKQVEDESGSDDLGAAGRIAVLIVTATRLYGEGIGVCLDSIEGLDVVGVERGVGTALRRVRETDPAVVLLDMDLCRALDLVRLITEAKPGVEVVALAIPEQEDTVIAGVEAGISGFLPRNASLQDLQRAIVAAVRGELACSPRIARCLLDEVHRLSSERRLRGAPSRGLTPREVEILDLIDQGQSNQEIADRLFIGVSTVKNHVHHILEKLGAQRRGEAAAMVRVARKI